MPFPHLLGERLEHPAIVACRPRTLSAESDRPAPTPTTTAPTTTTTVAPTTTLVSPTTVTNSTTTSLPPTGGEPSLPGRGPWARPRAPPGSTSPWWAPGLAKRAGV